MVGFPLPALSSRSFETLLASSTQAAVAPVNVQSTALAPLLSASFAPPASSATGLMPFSAAEPASSTTSSGTSGPVTKSPYAGKPFDITNYHNLNPAVRDQLLDERNWDPDLADNGDFIGAFMLAGGKMPTVTFDAQGMPRMDEYYERYSAVVSSPEFQEVKQRRMNEMRETLAFMHSDEGRAAQREREAWYQRQFPQQRTSDNRFVVGPA
ncbi:MAG: hypothetical protein ACAI38_22935 [Myxococcota bacterium]